MTTFSDQVFHLGGVPVGLPAVGVGKHFFVRPSTGADANSGKTPDRALKTLAAALGKCTANKGDVVYMIAEGNSASATTDYQSAGLDWNKDGVHLIGIGADPFLGQRSRIAQLSTVKTIEDLFTVSANNCVIANIAVFQGVADSTATSPRAMVITGDRNKIVNCQISGIGDTSADTAGARSLAVEGDENNLVNCFIGLDTVIRSTATTEIEVGNGRNVLDKCMIHSYTDATTFKALTTTSQVAGRFVLLRDTMMSVITNISSADTPTGAIAHAVAGSVYLMNSGVFGYDDVATADNADIYVLAPVGAVDSGHALGVDIA